jgi:hypothetical protein
MWLATVLPAAFETSDVALFRRPIGRPRILLLIWLVELVLVLLLELLLEPKSELRRPLRVVVEELVDVVSASPAVAVCSGATMQTKTATSSVATRRHFTFWENDGREFMRSSRVCRLVSQAG